MKCHIDVIPGVEHEQVLPAEATFPIEEADSCVMVAPQIGLRLRCKPTSDGIEVELSEADTLMAIPRCGYAIHAAKDSRVELVCSGMLRRV